MIKYSVEEVRAHAAILRDWRNGFDPGVCNEDAAGMLDAYANLLERIKADEGAVTDEVVEHACKVMGRAKGFYPAWPEMRAALLAVWPNPPAQAVDVEKVREVIAELREADSPSPLRFRGWADKLTVALQERGKCCVCDGPNTYDPESHVCLKCQDC